MQHEYLVKLRSSSSCCLVNKKIQYGQKGSGDYSKKTTLFHYPTHKTDLIKKNR